MNIEIIKQSMQKEAAMPSKGAKLLIKLFPHAARRVTLGFNFSKAGPAARGLGQLAGAIAKDIPHAGLQSGGYALGRINPLGKNYFARRLGTGARWLGLGADIALGAFLAPELYKRIAGKVGDVAGSMTGKAADKFYRAMNNTNDAGQGQEVVAGPDGSVRALFTPWSGLSGEKDWVPEKWIDTVQKLIPGEAGKQTAHLTLKGGAMALLAAGLVGGYRTAKHLGNLRAIDKADRPGKGLASQLSTTFAGDLSGEDDEKEQKKAASEEARNSYDIYSPGNFSAQNLTATALPVGTFLLAAGLTYKGVDSLFDKLRNKRLDKAIAEKEQAVKRLIAARAQIAKGSQTMDAAEAAVDPINDNQIYTKAASQEKEAVVKETVQLFGALSAAVILASAIGSYAYTSASDEDNMKYKAYRKALKEYAKAKTGMTPITMAPSDSSDYFASIDAAKQQATNTPRNQPSYDADALNKPISVSF